MSILIFFIVLFVLVLVHEWGHFITAKMTGMRVDEFGIGFPPKLFGIRKGETEYTINALPIGGFVKIYGEDGVVDPSLRSEESDHTRSFTGKNRWAQALVLVAGVTMNVIFAWLLFSGAFMWGIERAVEEHEASDAARLIVTDVLEGGPAANARLPLGASITAVQRGDTTLEKLTPSAFGAFISAEGGAPVEIAYMRGDELFVTQIAPSAGIIAAEPDRRAVGIALALVDRVEYPFFSALGEGFMHTIESTKMIAVGTVTLLRDAVIGEADFSQVAGPVGIVGLVGEASAFGFSALLMFTAFISLNLAVINLLPFPALDGGRLLFVGIESVTRRPIPPRITQVLNMLGFGMLIVLMIVITWHDIARLL